MYSNNFSIFNEKEWIDSINKENFTKKALSLFHFQYQENTLYRNYVDIIHRDISTIQRIEDIPFLPIHFFKTHIVHTTSFETNYIFESSGTTNAINSKHFVKNIQLYETSFLKTFETFYGNIEDIVIIGLLPSYIERQNASLLYMTDALIKRSKQKESGFYLHDFAALAHTLSLLQKSNKKVILLGVTFALLDFAEAYPMDLSNITIMETGGMKGRATTMTKEEMHTFLKNKWNIEHVHAEYGMTELLSQAYSFGDNIYQCPTYFQILIREENDPFAIQKNGKGAINVIDLANVYSCAFIATEDIGTCFENGNFSIHGRMDYSALRGCSQMTV